jgi:hypothetical protein
LSGRIIALVSFVAVGILAAAATRRFGGDRVDAVFGGGCALGFCYLIAPSWVAADDPQTLGEALMLGGLVSYISRPPDRIGLLRTAVLVTLGGFVKHNVVAIPVAITFDMAIRSSRRLSFWFGCCTGLTMSGFEITHLVAGGAFVDHLLSRRVFAWHGAHYHLMKYLHLSEFPLAIILLFARPIFWRDRRILAAYGIISIPAATIFAGFEGTSYNMFQDTVVFLAVASGVMLHELRGCITSEAAANALAAKFTLSVAPLLLTQADPGQEPGGFCANLSCGRLAGNRPPSRKVLFDRSGVCFGRQGPAICESLLLCYRAGQPFTLDPFNSRQLILAGKLDQNELIQRIAARAFGVVQLRADICDDPEAVSCHMLHDRRKFNRFTDEVLYAVDRY